MAGDNGESVVITEHCAKCGEEFETLLEPDGAGGRTAMTVCPLCFQRAVAPQ